MRWADIQQRHHQFLAMLLGWPKRTYVLHPNPAAKGAWTFRETQGARYTTALTPQSYPGIENLTDPDEVMLFAIERMIDFRMEASRGTS